MTLALWLSAALAQTPSALDTHLASHDVYTYSDGSSILSFHKDQTFKLQPIGSSGRTVEGVWTAVDGGLLVPVQFAVGAEVDHGGKSEFFEQYKIVGLGLAGDVDVACLVDVLDRADPGFYNRRGLGPCDGLGGGRFGAVVRHAAQDSEQGRRR